LSFIRWATCKFSAQISHPDLLWYSYSVSACSNFAWIGSLFWYTTLEIKRLIERERERIHQVGTLFSDLSNLKQSNGALSNSWWPICTDLSLNVFSLAHNWAFQICVSVTLIFLYHVQELCVPREYVKMSDPKFVDHLRVSSSSLKRSWNQRSKDFINSHCGDHDAPLIDVSNVQQKEKVNTTWKCPISLRFNQQVL